MSSAFPFPNMDSRAVMIRLEAEAQARGSNITEACRRAGVARAVVTKAKAGTCSPRLSTIQRLSKAVNSL